MYQYDTYDQAMVDARVEEFRDQVKRRLEGKMTEEQVKILRATWAARHTGAGNAHLPAILAGGLDTDIRSVSWLPLYHDMGLLMIMFPALSGGYLTLMSPLAFLSRPARWLRATSAS